MAGKIRSLLESLASRIVGQRTSVSRRLRHIPRSPKLRPRVGHRGMALRSLTPGEMDLSPENMAKWRELSKGAVEGFIYNQEPLFVHSSSVAMVQYFIEDEKLMIEFNNGSAYMYDDISEEEARLFTRYWTKGGWVWDFLRVRGKGNAKKYKKTYKQIR